MKPKNLIITLVLIALALGGTYFLQEHLLEKERRKEKTCKDQIIQIEEAIEDYQFENGNYPPRPEEFIKGKICPITGKGYEDALTKESINETPVLDFKRHRHH